MSARISGESRTVNATETSSAAFFGIVASSIKTKWADHLAHEGDLDGIAVWRRILEAIEELTRGRRDGESTIEGRKRAQDRITDCIIAGRV
jgi:hypothetical protein